MTTKGHGGELVLAGLSGQGVDAIFTLSGGHIFPVYDACVKAGLPIVDVRHEQTATFAAEGMAKLTRRPGVAVLTAGPGVTNGVSATTTARFNGSPLVVLAGRAPQGRWGAGSLQELDHVPILAPITKSAGTVSATADIPAAVRGAVETALTPHRGPVFLDFPLDVLFGEAEAQVPPPVAPRGAEPDPRRRGHEPWIVRLRDGERAAREAERPELEAGGDLVHPARVYGELRRRLDRDAVVVCDGGDFVSYAGRLIDSYEPGCWMDPGPYGCLGTGLGYSIAARVCHPDRQVVALLGAGALRSP